jgi:hypothetical protein
MKAHYLVRMRGLEPPRCRHHRLLRPARLPVPPHPLKRLFIMRTRLEGVKKRKVVSNTLFTAAKLLADELSY